MMQDMKNQIFFFNTFTKTCSAFNRLIHCTFPRSVGHLSREIDNCVSKFKDSPFPDDFESEFIKFITDQDKNFRNELNSYLLDKLLPSPSIEVFDLEAGQLINALLSGYVGDQRGYVSEMLQSKSRISSKLKLLDDYITDCDYLVLKSNDENLILLRELRDWLLDKRNDLIVLDKK